jgi:triosephosphate isomerase (TIM)
MADRVPLVAANWKMNKTIEEAERFPARFLPRVPDGGVDAFVCPSYLALKTAVEHCAQSRVSVAAQNMHQAESGAYTGEVSAPMLIELGVDGVILGHSERRQHFGETDEALAAKLPAAMAAGLLPILCIGEREEERDAR